MPERHNDGQLSFDCEPQEDRIDKNRQKHRIKSIATAFKFIGLSNQKNYLADNEISSLCKRLNLAKEAIDAVYNELYGKSDITQEEFPDPQIQSLLEEEEVGRARSYLSSAKSLDVSGAEVQKDACFYCHLCIKAGCVIPKYPEEMRYDIFKFDFFEKEARKEFIKQLSDNPDTICCPKIDK